MPGADDGNEEMSTGRTCLYLGWAKSDRAARRKLTRIVGRVERAAGRPLFPRDDRGGLRFTPSLLSEHLPHLLRARFVAKSRQVTALLDELHSTLEQRVQRNERDIKDIKRDVTELKQRSAEHDVELDRTLDLVGRQAETVSMLASAYGSSE